MNVVVTGGGTVAPIDDVRHIANASTGRLSAMIAEACLRRGADVWHVHAPGALLPFRRSAEVDLDANPAAEARRIDDLRADWLAVRSRLHLRPVRPGTVAQYARVLRETLTERPIDVAFLAMAASDYEPEPVVGKLPSGNEPRTLVLRPLPKVIRSVRDWSPGVFLVGFKLLSRTSTDDLIREARAAGRVNRADLTVANDLQTVKGGRHTIHLVREDGPAEALSGEAMADDLVERVFLWASRR